MGQHESLFALPVISVKLNRLITLTNQSFSQRVKIIPNELFVITYKSCELYIVTPLSKILAIFLTKILTFILVQSNSSK
jgi:hypothetical protein